MENYKHPKMTIEQMNDIWRLCKTLGIDPEQYKDVQYAGKLIFDLTKMEIGLERIEAPDPADYKAGGKYDYTRY